MKEQIKAVQLYFKGKVLNGDFKIVKNEPYTSTISVDDEFQFVIWTGNWDLKETRKNYSGALSFIDLALTEDEAIRLHEIMKPEIEKYMKDVLIEYKRKELEALEKSLL